MSILPVQRAHSHAACKGSQLVNLLSAKGQRCYMAYERCSSILSLQWMSVQFADFQCVTVTDYLELEKGREKNGNSRFHC